VRKGPGILLVTDRRDLAADHLVLAMRRRNVDFVRWNLDTYPDRTHFSVDPFGRGTLTAGGSRWPLDGFHTAWFRGFRSNPAGNGALLTSAEYLAAESRSALENLFTVAPWRWVNAYQSIATAAPKLEQLRRAARLGLGIPATLVTSSAPDGFAPGAELVAKAVNGPVFGQGGRRMKVFTEPVTRAGLTGGEPLCLQEHVTAGADLRVTVVGGRAFTVEISGRRRDRPDWRRLPDGEVSYREASVDAETLGHCVELVRSYGLSYAAIDLLAPADSAPVFLELNSSGQWAWLERHTGHRITDALVDLLLEP
jgi:hypothetical protein